METLIALSFLFTLRRTLIIKFKKKLLKFKEMQEIDLIKERKKISLSQVI